LLLNNLIADKVDGVSPRTRRLTAGSHGHRIDGGIRQRRLVQLHPTARLSIHRRRGRGRHLMLLVLLLRLVVLGQRMLLQGLVQHTLLLHRRRGRAARRAGRGLQGTGVDRQRLEGIEALGHVRHQFALEPVD